MLASELITDIRAELDEPVAAFWSDARLLALINKAERDYIQKTRCLSAFATMSTVAGTQAYPMPTYWLGSVKALYNDSTDLTGSPNWRPMESTSLEKLSQERPNFISTVSADRGKPMRYAIHGQEIYLHPCPDTTASNNLMLFFEAKPTPLTTTAGSINIDDSLSRAIVEFCLWKAWAQDNEDAKAAESKQNYIDMIGEGFKWKKKQQLDARWRLDVESGTPFSYGSSNIGNPPGW